MRCVIAAMLLLFSTSAIAGNNAGYEMGGQYARFDPVVSQYNQSGELFRIEGHCQSACTLFLGIRNVCIGRGATLLFHAAHDRSQNVSASLTSHMLDAYNARLRDYVTAHHYMDTLEFHPISGGDMIRKFGYRACPK
jgi:hypothetical protein